MARDEESSTSSCESLPATSLSQGSGFVLSFSDQMFCAGSKGFCLAFYTVREVVENPPIPTACLASWP